MNLHESTVKRSVQSPSVENCNLITDTVSPVSFENKEPYSIAYFLKGEKKYPMQSLRAPADESARIVDNWLTETSNSQGLYVLLGITSMYLITEFLSKLNKHSELLIIEPSQPILEAFMESNDLDQLNLYRAGVTFTCTQGTKVSKNFRQLLNSRHNFCKGIFVSPANARFRPELLEAKEQMTVQVKLEALDRVTTAKFADEWLQNCLINLPELINSPGIERLYNSFPQTDCLIVCAGPSLNDSIELIKSKQKNCFIIAVGTALKPLINAGIDADITIVVDSDPKVYKQFEGLNTLPGYLLATHTIFPGIYQHFKDKSICFNSIASNSFYDWLHDGDVEHGLLHVGGTVALSAIDCALRLSFRNIFVFGLDLAYANDGTSHAKNSMYEGHKANNGLIEIPGNWNKKVKTTKQFAHYVEILNGYLAENFSGYSGNFYNVNNSGAKFQDLDAISPEKASDLILEANQDFRKTLHNNLVKPRSSKIENLCDNSLEELKVIKNKCEQFLKKMESGEFPDGLEEFEDFLKASKVNNSLTGPALQAWCMNLGNQTDQDPFEMTKNFLTQLSGATEWVEGLLNNSYKRFLQQKKGVQ